jgi:hypothetical protein
MFLLEKRIVELTVLRAMIVQWLVYSVVTLINCSKSGEVARICNEIINFK